MDGKKCTHVDVNFQDRLVIEDLRILMKLIDPNANEKAVDRCILTNCQLMEAPTYTTLISKDYFEAELRTKDSTFGIYGGSRGNRKATNRRSPGNNKLDNKSKTPKSSSSRARDGEE